MRGHRPLLLLLFAQGCASPGEGGAAAEPPPPPPFIHVAGPPAPTTALEIPSPEPEWIAASRVPEFRKCAACHRVEQGASHGIGPNLYGVFGGPAATRPGYRYSPALAESGLVWDFATLDRFLARPRAVVPGSKMTFSGLADPEQRKAVIAFLKIRSDARRQPPRFGPAIR